MLKITDPIIQRFPDFKAQIDLLFQFNENFRDLCSDYILCDTMILDRKHKMNKYKEEIAEFEDLQQHLEAEILKEILKENLTP